MESKIDNPRRKFLGTVASGVAALSLSTLVSPLSAHAKNGFITNGADDPDAWFNKLKGKHRIVFDVPEQNGIFPFAWPRIFLATNAATGTPAKDCNAVVVLRHTAIPFAMEDRLWAKYDFESVLKVTDPRTNKRATKNPFWQPKQGDFQVPGLGAVPIGINELQADGVMFCVCDMALTVYSAVMAGVTKQDPAEVKKDWVSGILPDIQIVPAGVWAVNRAQEHGCSYCFTG